MNWSGQTLEDIGEFRLIEEILLPLARRFESETLIGDDCAFIPTHGGVLAVTADVGPTPLVQRLPFYEQDMESAGWHAVVTTASDIASAGATPLFLTNCIDAPPNLLITTFEQFMDGYFRACAHFGFRNAGGDIRQGPTLSARVFGVGTVQNDQHIGRGGATPGDHLVVIGRAGQFMATYILARAGDASVISSNQLLPNSAATLRFPEPQLREMSILAKRKLIRSASDSSDGLLGAISNISAASKCGFRLELDKGLLPTIVTAAANLKGYDPWNIFFSWGDWSIAAVVDSTVFSEFQFVCESENIAWLNLGSVTETASSITAVRDDNVCQMNVVRNENFVSLGFNAELQGHLEYMLRSELFSNNLT